MSTRGDLHIKSNGTTSRYLIKHDAFPEFFQQMLSFAFTQLKKTSEVIDETSLVKHIKSISPYFLELDNSDLYGGMDVTLDLDKKTIIVKNTDAERYKYKPADYFVFEGDVRDFLDLDIVTPSMEEVA